MEMTHDELVAKLRGLVGPILENQGVDLVDLKISGNPRRYLIDVRADLPSGGISLAQCALSNRALVRELEETGLLPGDYVVEVSSPGLDWPLVTERDFTRVMNRKVRVTLREPLDGKMEYIGTVTAVSGGTVCLAGDGPAVVITMDHIQKAVQFL